MNWPVNFLIKLSFVSHLRNLCLHNAVYSLALAEYLVIKEILFPFSYVNYYVIELC